VLTRARLKGLQLAIDDFGTGYSSLKMLRRMPFTTLKIDREFVGDLVESHDSQAITKSIIDLAANMNLECIAEGVGHDAVAVMLEQLGVGAIQGYLIARPMAVESVASWLASWAGGGGAQPVAVSAGDTTATAAPSRLSRQQRDIMRLLAQGQSVKQIARNLNLAPGAVKVHLSLAYVALGARNRVDAVTRLTQAEDDRGIAAMA
jgi:DNA-binding CsgD family transcriptional regulator